jgi:hypothetical protein
MVLTSHRGAAGLEPPGNLVSPPSPHGKHFSPILHSCPEHLAHSVTLERSLSLSEPFAFLMVKVLPPGRGRRTAMPTPGGRGIYCLLARCALQLVAGPPGVVLADLKLN